MIGHDRVLGMLLAGALAISVDASPATAQTFGDWELACEDGPQSCALSQANAERGTGNIVMRSRIHTDAEKRLFLSLTLPGSVNLTQGPWLTVDGLYLDALQYTTCPNGCQAALLLSNRSLGSLAEGNAAKVTVEDITGQRIGITISLKGLSAGLVALQEAVAAPAEP